MGKTLFVSDLDGTLLSSDSKISAASVEMLNEAIRRGALFSIATARTPSTVAGLLSDVNASLPFIVMTGAAMWNPADKKFHDPVTLHPDTAGEILATLRRHSLPSFIYVLSDNVIDIYHTGPVSDLERKFISERTGSQFKHFHIPADGNSDIPSPLSGVTLFYTMQPSPLVEEAYHDIRGRIDCNPIFYHDMFGPETGIMEIFSPSASKASALRKLKKSSGAERVVVFGDNLNDIPMMKEADLAVAVENAVAEVKEAADVIIGPNTSDSVARFILENIKDPSGIIL